jgi:hypothetical protein
MEVFTVTVLRAGNAVAYKRDTLHNINRGKPLGSLRKQHHTRQGQLRTSGKTFRNILILITHLLP